MDKKTIDEFNNMIKNQSNVMLPSVISPNSVIGGGGGETQWNDGILEFVSGWNSEIGNIVPYAHPDYLYYKIGSKYNANLTGYTYNFTQIGTDTVSNINTVTGIALGGLIGGAIGATVGGTYGGLMGSIVGGALGGYFANKGCQALEDERGTVWSQIDKDPELVNKGTVYFPSYYAHFKVISVGPYYVDDYYFPMPQ
ncbi:MAG TPA: hypothetical protein GXX41_06375 [Thermoanaerobacterium sp.]|nr:hypothetical protein [Thermoanaerobacterium sp.]